MLLSDNTGSLWTLWSFHSNTTKIKGVYRNQSKLPDIFLFQRALHYFLMAAESGNANAFAFLGKVRLIPRESVVSNKFF